MSHISRAVTILSCKETLQTCFRDKDALRTTILGLTFLTFNYRRQWLKLALLVTIEILFFMSLYKFARTQKKCTLGEYYYAISRRAGLGNPLSGCRPGRRHQGN